MIIVIEPKDIDKYPDLMDKMFRLRTSVFYNRLKWMVRVQDGKEFDKFDIQRLATYVIYTDNNIQKVIGSLRFLPMTGSTLISDVFPESLPENINFNIEKTWECTRLCLDERLSLKLDAVALIAGGFETALRAGIETIIGDFYSSTLRLYKRIGCEVEVLGYTDAWGRRTFAGSHPVSEKVINNLKLKLGDYAYLATIKE
jgi:N-acyl-L-homoserine lactone synthetase